MNVIRKCRHLSELLAENREFMRIYKQLTPTRNGTTLDTIRYYRKHRDSTWKLFGILDTGIRDYGMKPHRYPVQALKLYACMYRIWRIQRRQERTAGTRRRR